MERQGRPRGPIETIASRLGIVAYAAALITIVREWGDWGAVWQAVAAGVVASPVGTILSGLVVLPISIVIGKVAPVKNPGLLGYELVSIGSLVGVAWACYLLARSFGAT